MFRNFFCGCEMKRDYGTNGKNGTIGDFNNDGRVDLVTVGLNAPPKRPNPRSALQTCLPKAELMMQEFIRNGSRSSRNCIEGSDKSIIVFLKKKRVEGIK